MKKTLLIVTVLLAVLVAVTGCSKKETAAAPAAVDYGARTDGPNYWMVKYDQPVTLHTVLYERPATPFLPGDSVTQNEWFRGLKEYLNVDIVVDWVSSSAGYTEKLNLAIASNELPDVIRVDTNQFTQLVEAGLVADITDYMENNLSDMLKEIIKAAPVVTETAKFNGRFMGLPRYGYGDLWNINDLWMRHDWVEAAGVEAPKSIADLEKIMDTFMAAHKGSYGFAMRKTLDEFYLMAAAWGGKPSIWIDAPDGSIVYGRIQPEMKDALAKFNEWYKKGYLRKDFMSMDDRAIIEDMAAEKVGIHAWGNWAGWTYVEVVRALGMDAYFQPYEIPSKDGKPAIFELPIDNSDYLVYNKNCKNIPAALKSLSFVTWVIMEATGQGAMTDEQVYRYLLGGEGRHDLNPFEVNDPYGNGPIMVKWAREVAENGYQIKSPPLTSEWPAQMEQAAPWWRDNSPEGYGRWIQQYAIPSSSWVNMKVIDEGRYVPTKVTGSMPEEAVSYGSTLDELLTEGFTKIIVGEQPLSYFDTLIQEWKASGGDVVTAAVNKKYGKK